VSEPAGRLHAEVDGHTATITIDNPAKRNAMTPDMWRSLPPLLDDLAADPGVRVAVLTGAGETFCAGADITSLPTLGTGGDAKDLAVGAENALAAFPKPVVAAIRGYCVGGGCQLAAACDLRIAADDARFAITPAKIGIVYPPSATTRVVRLIGASATKHLLYTADLIDAARALRIGLADELTAPADLAARVAELASTIAGRSQFTIRASKEIVDAIAAGSDVTDLATRWRAAGVAGPDAAEGIAAFTERRKPDFTWTG
jgi:enoyl-CoA hydratase/carnithine racemase